MKKIILGIIIGIVLSGSIASASIKLAQIPETILGYKTVDLLNDLAVQKYKDDYTNAEAIWVSKHQVSVESDPPSKRSLMMSVRTADLMTEYEKAHPKKY